MKEQDIAEALDPADLPSPRTSAPDSGRTATSAESISRSAEPADPNPAVSVTAPIFVVHGHDHALLHEVVRVLERATSREITVLHEQANRGRTLLEKFEAHALAASYAVVILTADDIGGAVGHETKPRGRQNVIFELGFFFGKLGRDRVCVLLGEGVEQPSDITGLVYVAADASGSWKYRLARELTAAGIQVSLDRIP